ncbi:hypothetical protein M2271_005609 [Streptomyces sp. LBL]|nr:hypothetical protein [Streptomyces sp. LBL]
MAGPTHHSDTGADARKHPFGPVREGQRWRTGGNGSVSPIVRPLRKMTSRSTPRPPGCRGAEDDAVEVTCRMTRPTTVTPSPCGCGRVGHGYGRGRPPGGDRCRRRAAGPGCGAGCGPVGAGPHPVGRLRPRPLRRGRAPRAAAGLPWWPAGARPSGAPFPRVLRNGGCHQWEKNTSGRRRGKKRNSRRQSLGTGPRTARPPRWYSRSDCRNTSAPNTSAPPFEPPGGGRTCGFR